MTCPKCGGEVAASEWIAPTRGEMAKGTLLDWRTWAIAVVVMGLTGLITGALGLPQGYRAGGGAAVGMLIAIRMVRYRKCPKCSAIAMPPG